MFGFGKKTTKDDPAPSSVAEQQADQDRPEQNHAEQDPSEQGHHHQESTAEPKSSRAEQGPFDISEITVDSSWINLGSLLVKPMDGVAMRIDVDQKRQSVVSISFQKGTSMLQVQAFAAPKSRGLWPEIRTDLAQSVRSQNGVVDITDGPLGRQVLAKIPASLPDGGRGFRVARFVGIDGPRWFLRGVFSGDAAVKQQAAAEFEELFRSIVVDRGQQPIAPRDLLPLRIPENAVSRHADEEQDGKADLPVPSRGPEITQIG